MKCADPDSCSAKKQPEKVCWEIVSELDDYRKAMKVCHDCIVYILKAEKAFLSEKEIKKILNKKQECPLA